MADYVKYYILWYAWSKTGRGRGDEAGTLLWLFPSRYTHNKFSKRVILYTKLEQLKEGLLMAQKWLIRNHKEIEASPIMRRVVVG